MWLTFPWVFVIGFFLTPAVPRWPSQLIWPLCVWVELFESVSEDRREVTCRRSEKPYITLPRCFASLPDTAVTTGKLENKSSLWRCAASLMQHEPLMESAGFLSAKWGLSKTTNSDAFISCCKCSALSPRKKGRGSGVDQKERGAEIYTLQCLIVQGQRSDNIHFLFFFSCRPACTIDPPPPPPPSWLLFGVSRFSSASNRRLPPPRVCC